MGKVFRRERLIVILSEAKNLSVEKPNQREILRRPAKIAGRKMRASLLRMTARGIGRKLKRRTR